MELDVVYKYRAPGEAPGDETTIESKTIDLTEDDQTIPRSHTASVTSSRWLPLPLLRTMKRRRRTTR